MERTIRKLLTFFFENVTVLITVFIVFHFFKCYESKGLEE